MQAARNNAAWCHAVCSAHGDAPGFGAAAWVNATRLSPPYYPNIVTLDPAADAAALGPAIDALAHRDGFTGFGIKDSFSRLDLASRGFTRMFDATWLVRLPAVEAVNAHRLGWSVADSASELSEWEAAWWARSIGEPAPAAPLFPAALLEHAGVSFLLGRSAESSHVQAGCALMDAAGCVGMACAFDGGTHAAAGLREMLGEIHRRHPAQPLVGYESGAALAVAVAAGFEPGGPLRVWVQQPAA